MSSKESILARIRQNKPGPVPLPDLPALKQESANLRQAFLKKNEAIGGKGSELASLEELGSLLKQQFPEAKTSIGIGNLASLGNRNLKDYDKLAELGTLDLAIIEGDLGVVENAAVWVSEQKMGARVLPFITQHLVLVLSPDKLVNDMHQAYAQIKIDKGGYGVFIAGPSKTADIEQSLVIGAQGARSCTVVFIKDF